ncbi:dephospho-CoA kinase [Paludisphaera mucosa]|uniref:Dephospho-CoA kinase n=1 Tax=Paludisphaera mucosa TaxID=3030827 RepID=A0ABT6F6K0_9BACT|nr:dephospho-CoA kinase [Paludisphaera mucosa]MDG3003116.1 dephospho-CoA kinase [Paludisphaera mucosa]
MPESSTTIGEPIARAKRWKHGAIPVVGLIGGVGGGKSAAAAALAARGAFVIDADSVGHATLRRPEVVRRLAERFGDGILDVDGGVDRRALGRIVFADEAARRDLESIVHPLMVDEFERLTADAERRDDARFVILDAAVLLESGWDRACDLVVYIDASQAIRLERVRRSRGWSAEELERREAAQWPVDRKMARADRVLINDGDVSDLESQVDRLVAWLDSAVPPTADRRPSPGPLP